jgi:hypothetical protein
MPELQLAARCSSLSHDYNALILMAFGKGTFARRGRKAARDKTLEALKALKLRLPLPATEGLASLLRQGLSRFLVYALRERAGIQTRRRADGIYFWCLPGQQAPDAEDRDASRVSEPARKKSPGRPPGSLGEAAQQRRDRVIRAWQERRYGTVSDLARAFGIDRATASKILKGAGLRP